VVLAIATAVGLTVPPAAAAETASVAALPEPVKLAPDLPGSSYFGSSVALSGDTVLVGAPEDNAPETESGSAIVYIAADGGGWQEQAKLVADDATSGDNFGDSVALDGDTAVVGAPYDRPGGVYDAGSAYVFVRSGSTWTQQAKLVPSTIGYDSSAAWSVAVKGDVAVVGQPRGGPGDGGGAVIIFTRSGTTWTEEAVLEDLETDQGTGFGGAVAIDGETLVVGQAPHGYVYGDPQYNSAYVYVGSGATWTLQAVLATSEVGLPDSFGGAVDVKGDTVVVGAGDCSAGGVREGGCAYVFQRSGTTWTQEAQLVGSEVKLWDRFGQAVAVDGKTIMVSSYDYDVAPGYGAGGAAYIFRRNGTTWTEKRLLVSPDPPANDHFGYAMDLERKAPGERTLVIGAFWHDHSRGAAYVYR